MDNYTYVKVKRGLSKIHGIGLFADQIIEPYTCIGLGFTEYDNENCYVYENARYINHSIFPNTILVRKNQDYYVFSSYTIEKGEEIVSNYYDTPNGIMKPYHFINNS